MAQFSLDHQPRADGHYSDFLGAADGRDGRALHLRGHRSQPGADAQPVSREPGLWRRSVGCGPWLRGGAAAPECAGCTHSILLTGLVAALSAYCFAASARQPEQHKLAHALLVAASGPVVLALLALTVVNALTPVGLRPVLVKDRVERSGLDAFEKWNSYSRIVGDSADQGAAALCGGRLPSCPRISSRKRRVLTIDGMAGTVMYHYDGTRESIDFLRYDLVNLAYNLPGINKAAIIGVGGGRDVLSAHLYGVPEIIGVELNPHPRRPAHPRSLLQGVFQPHGDCLT